MACGCNNYSGSGYGYGGCGCDNTVQYAPSACNSNFPTTCTALGTGVIQRVVGEDSSYCKYTVPTFTTNSSNANGSSILTYSSKTAGVVSWGDGSSAAPIFITSPDNTSTGQAYQSPLYGTTGVSLQATTATGQLVEFAPTSTYASKVQIPVVAPSGSTTAWGTIDNIIQTQGLVYKTGNLSTPANTVQTLSTTTANQVVSFNTTTGDPVIVSASSFFSQASGFLDNQQIVIAPAVSSGSTNLAVNFGQIVLQTTPNPGNGLFNTYVYTNTSALNINLNGSNGAGGLDTGSIAASTYYYVYAIYNITTNTIAVMCSLNAYTPALMPTSAGYTYYKMIGLFRTNSSSQIDSLYNQNGRIVTLGPSANQSLFSYTSTGSNTTVYWSGQLSASYPSGVDLAYLRINGRRNTTTAGVYNTWNVIITNSAVGTTGQTSTAVPLTNAVYGAGILNDIGSSTTSIGSIIVNTYVPTTGNSYYSIVSNQALITSGDFISINASGYLLNFI
jgi:hypothetical protein